MTEGVYCVDASNRARLLVTGADAKSLLQRLASNDLAALRPGEGVPTFFLERSGRIVDRVIAAVGEDSVLLIGSDGRGPALAEWIGRHVITEDAAVANLEATDPLVTVVGPGAGDVLGRPSGMRPFGLAPWAHRTLGEGLESAHVVRAEAIGGESYHILIPLGDCPLMNHITVDLGAPDPDDLRAMRISAGVPEWGAEFDERTNPLELGPWGIEAISFKKGCYVGQEVIARLRRSGRVKRTLVRARVDGDAVPAPGESVFEDDGEVGTITSSARHERDGVLVLARVVPDLAAPGTHLTFRAGSTESPGQVLTPIPTGGPA